MLLCFTKMHGLGSDFMVLDLVSQHAHVQPRHVKLWGDRSTGVGFGQLLIAETLNSPDIDFRYRIFSAGDSEVERYGNSTRCFARFAQDKRLTMEKSIHVETGGSIIELNVRPDGQVTVDMGSPRLAPAKMSFQTERKTLSYEVEVSSQRVELAAVSTDNPRGVLRVENVSSAPIHSLGPQLEVHPRFPKKANIGFLQVLDPHHARLRVWEHDVGGTQVCGTGTCAAAVIRIRQDWLQSLVQINLPGSHLHIEWASPSQPAMTAGPAVRVYEGQVRL